MATRTAVPSAQLDDLIKALLVLSRTVDEVLDARAVEAVVDKRLSPSKTQIIRLLGHGGGHTATQLACFLGVSKPAISQIIDAMVKEKIVVRKSVRDDRREITIALTARGKKHFGEVRRKQRHLLRNALRVFPKGAVGTWTAHLQTITQAVARSDNNFQEFCIQCGAHADGTCVLLGGNASCLFLQQRASKDKRANKRSQPTK